MVIIGTKCNIKRNGAVSFHKRPRHSFVAIWHDAVGNIEVIAGNAYLHQVG